MVIFYGIGMGGRKKKLGMNGKEEKGNFSYEILASFSLVSAQ